MCQVACRSHKHAEALKTSSRSEECYEIDNDGMSGRLNESREQVKSAEDRTDAKGVEDFVDERNGEIVDDDIIKVFVVNSDTNSAIGLEDCERRTGPGVSDETRRRVGVDDSADLGSQSGLDPIRPDGEGFSFGRDLDRAKI